MLLDTSGLFCCHHSSEEEHQKAVAAFLSSGSKLTHSYVLSEFVTLAYARGLPRSSTLAFTDALLSHPDVEVVWVDEAIYREALRFLGARMDKAYSLCDVVSFILMRAHGLQDALTTDHHFEQEGFRRML